MHMEKAILTKLKESVLPFAWSNYGKPRI